MSNLIIAELDNATIRKTEDGRISVYDLIEIVGGQKNPRDAWKSLTERYPDIVGKTDNVKFRQSDGRLQARFTPVADRAGALYIIGLLPGAVGRKYREESAKLVIRYIDADVTLATDIVQRSEDVDALKEHHAATGQRIEFLEGVHYLKAKKNPSTIAYYNDLLEERFNLKPRLNMSLVSFALDDENFVLIQFLQAKYPWIAEDVTDNGCDQDELDALYSYYLPEIKTWVASTAAGVDG